MFNVNPNCNELICNGTCKADCCGIVPMLQSSWWVVKDKVNKERKYQLQKFSQKGQTFVIPITEDFKCVFLNSENKCNIYNSPRRPNLCMLFGKVNNEPLLACPHINKDKMDLIVNKADKTMQELKAMSKKGDLENCAE